MSFCPKRTPLKNLFKWNKIKRNMSTNENWCCENTGKLWKGRIWADFLNSILSLITDLNHLVNFDTNAVCVKNKK